MHAYLVGRTMYPGEPIAIVVAESEEVAMQKLIAAGVVMSGSEGFVTLNEYTAPVGWTTVFI